MFLHSQRVRVLASFPLWRQEKEGTGVNETYYNKCFLIWYLTFESSATPLQNPKHTENNSFLYNAVLKYTLKQKQAVATDIFLEICICFLLYFNYPSSLFPSLTTLLSTFLPPPHLSIFWHPPPDTFPQNFTLSFLSYGNTNHHFDEYCLCKNNTLHKRATKWT